MSLAHSFRPPFARLSRLPSTRSNSAQSGFSEIEPSPTVPKFTLYILNDVYLPVCLKWRRARSLRQSSQVHSQGSLAQCNFVLVCKAKRPTNFGNPIPWKLYANFFRPAHLCKLIRYIFLSCYCSASCVGSWRSIFLSY